MNLRILTISACLGLSVFASQSACADYESWTPHFDCKGSAGASLQVRYKLGPGKMYRITGYAFYSPDGDFRVKRVIVALNNGRTSSPKGYSYGGTNKAVNANVSGIKLYPSDSTRAEDGLYATMSLTDLKGKECDGLFTFKY